LLVSEKMRKEPLGASGHADLDLIVVSDIFKLADPWAGDVVQWLSICLACVSLGFDPQ
jgi:hypothetical protein